VHVRHGARPRVEEQPRGFSRLAIRGRRVRGTRKPPKDSVEQQVDLTIDRPGFIASASDPVPVAVGLKEGSVMTAPVWGRTWPARSSGTEIPMSGR